jgi:phosphopantetheinyl transferase
MYKQQRYVIGNSTIYTISLDDFSYKNHLNCLNDQEIEKLNRFFSERRKNEFAAIRYLKEMYFPQTQILYNAHGVPILSNGFCISISHTAQLAGFAYSEKEAVGFDLEHITEKVQRVKSKFLHHNDYALCDVVNTESLTKIWSAKEAIYKLKSEDDLVFSEAIYLQHLQYDNWQAVIRVNNTEISIDLTIFTVDGIVHAITQKYV